MATIGVQEFQELSGLSDAALVWLLKNNRLKCKVDPQRGLQICFENGDVQQLIEASAVFKDELGRRAAVLKEKAARIIRDHFERIIEEAIEKAIGEHRL